jgi:hypothetical protein
LKGKVFCHAIVKNHLPDPELYHKRQGTILVNERKSKSAGMSPGRIAYGMLHGGKPHCNFPMQVLIAAKNGATIGEINHSPAFVRNFGMACASVILAKKKNYMNTPLDATGRKPPAAVGCDKMTEKRCSNQMTAFATINPHAPSKYMVQTYFLGSLFVRDHTGKGLAASVVKVSSMISDTLNG